MGCGSTAFLGTSRENVQKVGFLGKKQKIISKSKVNVTLVSLLSGVKLVGEITIWFFLLLVGVEMAF